MIRRFCVGLIFAALLLTACSAFAQLNWDGQTGAVLTPFAYTAASPAKGLGKPVASFHYLAGGDSVGNNFQMSITEGLFKRIEIGYTRSQNAEGSTEFAPLFQGGYNTFTAKANFLPENVAKTKWVPALAVGFAAHTNVKRAANVVLDQTSESYDVYLVGTKTITQIPHLPIVVSGGVKGTDASLFAIAGNASEWQARGFGTVAFVVSGPSRTKLILGSEAVQQPHYLQDLPGATLPTSLTYFARVVAPTERPLNFDFAVVQAAGKVAPGVDLNARARFAMGISYQF